MLLAWFSVVLQGYLSYSLNSSEVPCFIKKNIEFYLVFAYFFLKGLAQMSSAEYCSN